MWPQSIRRVIVAEHRVDFRRYWDGLLAEAYKLGLNPYDGDCLVFLRGDRTQLRAIAGDPLGLFLIMRRFEGGRLRANFAFARDPKVRVITYAELMLLFEGASYTVHKRVKAWR